MTVRLYAERKGWTVDRVEAHLTRQPEAGRIEAIEVELILGGDLDDEQRARLREIAARCPVHRTLAGGVRIGHR
jgi:putative redox protein